MTFAGSASTLRYIDYHDYVSNYHHRNIRPRIVKVPLIVTELAHAFYQGRRWCIRRCMWSGRR